MTRYYLTLKFNNLDNSLYTDQQAAMQIEILSDDISHARLLAERFRKVMDADDYKLVEMYKESK
jgi:hypothetical protein